MSSGKFKYVIYKMCLEIIYLIYEYKKNLVLNIVQWLICHKTKQNKTKIKNDFILVSLLNGTLTFVVYLKPKSFLFNNKSGNNEHGDTSSNPGRD